MRSEDIATEIATLEPECARMAQQLDELIDSFRPHLVTIAGRWIGREVERRIREHPEHIERLGLEKVRSLKSRVQALIQSLPQAVKNETSDKNDWPHYRLPDTTGYGHGKQEPFFNKAFRNVISHVGGILDEFGLLAEHKGYAQSWERIGTGGFRYAINPGFDDLTCSALKRYDESLPAYQALVDKIERKKKEMAQAKAGELWDSA